jgi:hypothetical protein
VPGILSRFRRVFRGDRGQLRHHRPVPTAAANARRGTKRLQPGAIRGTHDIAPPAAATTAFRSQRRDRPLDMETP